MFQFIHSTWRADIKEAWFHVTPQNNTWETSKISFESQFISDISRIRVEFAVLDAYIDDIKFNPTQKCTSTPQHRSWTRM